MANTLNCAATAPGYHLAEIERGVFGEASKIREEVEELLDAEAQGVRLMALVELSDLVGAVEGYAARQHPGHDLTRLLDCVPEAVASVEDAADSLVEADAKKEVGSALAATVALLGAIELRLTARYPGFTMADLRAMSAVTQRAFRNGRRSPSPGPHRDGGSLLPLSGGQV